VRDRGLRQIGEENDLKAYQVDQSGFLWAVLEVLRHTDAFSEPDFQALIERGRLAAIGQGGMMAHSADIAKADQEQREREVEGSEPGVGPPRPVMPGEGDSPTAEFERLTEAQEREAEAVRQAPASTPATEAEAASEEAEEEEAEEADDEEEEEDKESDEAKAAARGLELRDYGPSVGMRVYDPKTKKMVARSRLNDPVPAA
jgi:hypothetical protein